MVNGTAFPAHVGGNSAFHHDITEALNGGGVSQAVVGAAGVGWWVVLVRAKKMAKTRGELRQPSGKHGRCWEGCYVGMSFLQGAPRGWGEANQKETLIWNGIRPELGLEDELIAEHLRSTGDFSPLA